MMQSHFCFNGKFQFHGGDKVSIEEFLLFFSIGEDNPSIEALLSACALGILHDDLQLSELVLKELTKYERSDLWCHHVAFLASEFYLKKVRTSGIVFKARH